MACRATISLQLGVQSSLLSYDVQSHPSQLGIQSHHLLLVWLSEPPFPCSSAFRVIIVSQLWRSETSFLVWHSKMLILNYGVLSLHLLQFGIQSRHLFSVMTFRDVFPTISFQFGIQSHHPFLVIAFRATFSVMAFRVIVCS